MIQLYKVGNNDFIQNGDHVLFPESCELDRKLNGAWELSMVHPIDEDGIFEDIIAEAVIKAPTPEGEKLFYIYDVEKISEDAVEVCARPIFLQASKEVMLLDVRPTNKTGQEALDIMTAGTRYSGKSNIKTSNTAYYIRKNLLEAINGKSDNTFIKRWGGEILYDDFTVIINEKVGGDYGVNILYGKNMEYVRERTNIESVVTRIIPVSYNGHTLAGDTPWVDSPLIDKYTHVHTKVIEYDDVKLAEDISGEDEEGFQTLELLREELVRRAEKEFEAGMDRPKVTLEVNMIDLSSTKEYAEYEILESVSLGDIISCEHHIMRIATSARVIRQKYDCIQERNIKLVIGDFQHDYFSNVNSVINSISQNLNSNGNLMAEKVEGILNGIQTQIRLQSSVAKKVEGRAFTIEDLDPDSDLYGAMIFGTQGLQIATKRTADGRDWDWTTAVTAKGIVADAIITGLLTDKTGKNYWNLDTGEFSLSAGTIIGDKTIYQIIKAELDAYTDAVLSQAVSNLESKINKKVETWYQSTDPSVDWTGTTEVQWLDHNGEAILDQDGNPIMILWESEKYEHEGDLWQNETDNTEWIYRNGKWVRMNVPDEVFDKIDGKAQVFNDTPVPPYNVGDLWFQSETSDIMTCVTARTTGSFVSADWEKRNRYTDDGALNDFISDIFNPKIIEIQRQLDGQLETFFFDYEPALDNYPASEWTTEEARATHEGDLFFCKTSGYSYRFFKNNDGTWSWNLVQDTDTTKALALAAEAKDIADGKRRVFIETPYPPYDIGDLWVQGESGDLMRCQISRASGSYSSGDWVKATKYTDDSYAKQVEKNLEVVKADLTTQIDGKIESYNQTADPSGAWTTDTAKTQHTGDLWYNPTTKLTKRWNGTGWGQIDNAQAAAAEALAKEKNRVFNVTPVPPYDIGDLWVQGSSGDIMRCKTARSSGSYVSSDWERASKYTDDTTINNFINNEYANTIEEIKSSIDKKAETWRQDSDPASEWTELENTAWRDHNGNSILDHTGNELILIWEKEKAQHEGDLWKRTTDNTEWIYQNGTWMPMDLPDSLFDELDGKAQIFMSTPYTPYAEGDLWVTSTTSGKAAIKICTTDRKSGSFVSTDWIDPKYVDDNYVSTALKNYDTALDQLAVFTKLTGGITEQGLFVQNGRVYINATYILAGMLAGKFIDAKGITVKDTSGNITLSISEKGEVTILATSFKLAGKTVTEIVEEEIDGLTQEEMMDKLTNGSTSQGIYLNGTKIYINGQYIKALSVATNAIAAGAVTAAKISVDDLVSLKATIGGWKISTNVIYSPSVNDNVGAVALYSGGGTSESYLQFRHTENGSWINDLKISGTTGITSGDGTQSLSLIRNPDLSSQQFSDGSHHSLGSTYFYGYTQINADFKVSSGYTKSVQRETENYGIQDFYCYETPTPSLGDFGDGTIAEDGLCYVEIDDIFRESVNTGITYYVFLQKEGPGECWIKERCESYFIVEGTPGLRFAYEIKAKQRELEHIRFTDGSRNTDYGFAELNYEAMAETERLALIEEMEEAYGEYL